MTKLSSSPPPPLTVLGGGGATVAGSAVDVGSGGGGSVVAMVVGTGGTALVLVGAEFGGAVVAGATIAAVAVAGDPLLGPPGGGLSVLRGVRMTGVSGTNVAGAVSVPAPVTRGHGCSVIGNSRQLSLSTQTFSVKAAFCAPRQSRMRRPSISLALKHVTPVLGSATLKNASLDMINTAWVSSFTQN